ncbi:hypothetical protein J2T12_003794 [Paenibacillus anaericanus]|uniref:acyltransferase domain-containing protein n=1 Tax=Paenibacillus anaericanus TaxID=170367 RepID=UPI002789A02A|nr:acyltransferase domain-containing protein [Paenibacillus anaericanus]MDQ0090371.1 hypothetical protein [Paenibacillus anaericanus]
MSTLSDFNEAISYCEFDYLPEGIEEKYKHFELKNKSALISHHFLHEIFGKYQLPEATQQYLLNGIEAIEQDSILYPFTSFLVEDMCSARNRCDIDFYTNMTPGCMKSYGELYSFLLLLACVTPSMEMLAARGIPKSYYEDIPHQPLKLQLDKIVQHNDASVHDFAWVMNFYTCSIFLLDRFLFIPYQFDDHFTMYRHVQTQEVVALRHAGEQFRSDGQKEGINGVYDRNQSFTSIWNESEKSITANRINPMGFVEKEPITLDKSHWKPALIKGDILLALHIPSGPGYTPDRLKTSMKLAIELYRRYFPELSIQGFWSASWLYDSRLSLVLDNETSNIVKVQRQFYNYPTDEGDKMIRYEIFGDGDADPVRDQLELTTSLQKAAAEYMKKGARFNSLSMIVLKEDLVKMGHMPYITTEDVQKFYSTVDTHL